MALRQTRTRFANLVEQRPKRIPGLQRAQPGHAVFAETADCNAYLVALREAAATHGVAVHAYALLPGEVRLLATPTDAQALGRMVQAVGRRFTAASNLRHGRSGWSHHDFRGSRGLKLGCPF